MEINLNSITKLDNINLTLFHPKLIKLYKSLNKKIKKIEKKFFKI